MAYYTCNDCQYYDKDDTNRWDEGYCTERNQYYPRSDRACSRFKLRNDISTTCFLTTAMCDIFGFEDNCFGLETMRRFRDTVLVNDSKYYPLLAEYEVVGPIISGNLYRDKQRDMVADYYFENYLYDIIVNLSTRKDYNEAVDRYVEMVNDMKRMYCVNHEVTEDDVLVLAKKIENKQYKVKKSK